MFAFGFGVIVGFFGGRYYDTRNVQETFFVPEIRSFVNRVRGAFQRSKDQE